MNSFIEQALIFIGSAVIFVPLFRKLGLGSVLGYLVAGIIVGPFGLKLIHDAESVIHFSELGVVMLLFVIGLEIQPHKLWSMRRHLFGLGGLQILFCTTLFSIIGVIFNLPLLAAIVIAFAMSLSSTAFAVQMLSEKNQFKTEFGRSAFAILLAQDLVAIPALALIPALAAKELSSHSSPGISLVPGLMGIGVIIALVVGSRFLVRPILQRLADMRSREIFTAAILFIVLGVAAIMQKLGLAAALGTFIAGVLLADSEFRHEIEADLDPFKSLLLGLFFISVGMGVNLEIIIQRPLAVIFLTVGYLAIKFGSIYSAARLFKLDHENSKLTALSIAQGGEFAFVIFAIVTSQSLIASETINLLSVVITLSMVLSPLLLMVNDKLSQRSQQRNKEPEHYDEIKDEDPDVLIAGFGRFGQVIARVLKAQGISFVAIDHNVEQIDLVRKFGNKVYYGDISRLDILEAAGAGKAKYFVLAVGNVEASLKALDIVKHNFPHLKIFARARNRGHVFDLLDLGIQNVKRDTFDSSADFAREILVELGFPPERAKTIIEKFKAHDEIMLGEQYKVRRDDKMFVSVSRQATEQLAEVLRSDSMQTLIGSSDSKPAQI